MSDGMVVISKEELAALIADALGGGVTLGGSWEGVSEIVARVVDALPTSEPDQRAAASDELIRVLCSLLTDESDIAEGVVDSDGSLLDMVTEWHRWQNCVTDPAVLALLAAVYPKPGDSQ